MKEYEELIFEALKTDSEKELKKLVIPAEEIIISVLDMILERWEQSSDYPYIDTKIDVITGKNFSDKDEFYKRREIIYSWIQGRALEALASHAVWLSECSILDDAGKKWGGGEVLWVYGKWRALGVF